MRSVHEPPMRSEDDLRAVLAQMEHYAPDMDTVLRKVRERGRPRRRSGWLRLLARRSPESPRWPRLMAGAAIAAALAGLAIALVPGMLTAGQRRSTGGRRRRRWAGPC
jgi:hypothetical protein